VIYVSIHHTTVQ